MNTNEIELNERAIELERDRAQIAYRFAVLALEYERLGQTKTAAHLAGRAYSVSSYDTVHSHLHTRLTELAKLQDAVSA